MGEFITIDDESYLDSQEQTFVDEILQDFRET